LDFTSDLERFEKVSGLKETLKDVKIIALRENTHGLGEIFKVKNELNQTTILIGWDMLLKESFLSFRHLP
jgi:erythromycin esterase-like protein